MPLMYGEGMRAFRRLQEEIIKRNNDLTIFAWAIPQDFKQPFVGLFAPSPATFAASSGIVPFSDDFANFSATNRGLFLTGDIPLRAANVAAKGSHVETLYALFLGLKLNTSASGKNEDTNDIDIRLSSRKDGGIYLHKIGPNLFCRDGLLPLAGFESEFEQVEFYEVTDAYILLDPTTTITTASSSYRKLGFHIPFHDKFLLQRAMPESLWDQTDRIFLRPKRYHWTMYPTVLAMTFSASFTGTTVPMAVLCDYRKRVPILKVFNRSQYARESTIIFQEKYREDTISWEDLYNQAPSIHTLSNSMEVRFGSDVYLISVSFKKGIVETIRRDVEVLSLVLTYRSLRRNM